MGIFIFLPRIVMNNSTRNFTNSSNAQNSSSFKDKLRKLTTGVALAGTLMVGNPSCTSCSHEKNIDQEAKNEQVEKKVIEQSTDSITDMDDFYKKAALKAAIAEQEDISEELDMEIEENKAVINENKAIINGNKAVINENKAVINENKAVINENKAVINENKAAIRWYEASDYASMERQAKDRETVTSEELNFNKDLQKALLGYLKDCKEVGYEPSAHCKKLLASIKK